MILGLLAILGCLLYAGFPAAWHYRLFHDEASLLQILSTTEPGASLTELESRLGLFDRVHDEHRSQLISGYERAANSTPDAFPDGVTDRDEFIRLRMDDAELNLQVRDKRLVNFNPRNFDQPSEPVHLLNPLD